MTKKVKDQSRSVTGPLLDDLVKQDKANFDRNFAAPAIGEVPLAPPDLYQDSGGGYNPDFTFPQE